MAPHPSTDRPSAGTQLRRAVERERPLQLVGVVNAMAALLAERAGFSALYLSGAGVANASCGIPDLGWTRFVDVWEDARRITAACELPLLVDADTGWSEAEGIAQVVRRLMQVGVAGLHLEDQVEAKRCGHRPGKQLVSTEQMVQRVREAVAARGDDPFVVMARTDAAATEGLDGSIQRARRYVEAGADMIFAEALTAPEHFRQFAEAVDVPVLANMTEFGRTPLMTTGQLRDAGIRLVLYPLSAFRAMNAAAAHVYETIRREGTQDSLLDQMQTRDQLYELLDYHAQEKKIDETRQN